MEEQREGKEDEDEEGGEGEGGGSLLPNNGTADTDSKTIEAGAAAFLCACTLSGVAAPDIVRAPLVG